MKHRIESLDKETSKKEIEFGESQKALAEYSQTLDEVDSWLSRAENQTFDEEETDEEKAARLEEEMLDLNRQQTLADWEEEIEEDEA